MLHALGFEFTVVPADVDETELADEAPVAYVERIARKKAAVVAGDAAGRVVLAADTTVDVDGEILAKPVDDDDARRMLRLMSGRTHHVHTAVVVSSPHGIETVTVTTDVTFVPLTDTMIEWYLAIGEHRDKAGAYGMQGAGGALVARIDGSPSNVVGLPLAETWALVHRATR
jgi:septum formation protein